MAEQASAAVQRANANAPELKVGVFHLGKCWFRLIESSGERAFTVSFVLCFCKCIYHAFFDNAMHCLVSIPLAVKVW